MHAFSRRRRSAGAVLALALVGAALSPLVVAPAAADSVQPARSHALAIHGDYADADGTPVFGANRRVEIISGHAPTYTCMDPANNEHGPVVVTNSDIVLVPRVDGKEFRVSITAFGGLNLGTSVGITGRSEGRVPAGTYDVYFDECQNGAYEPLQDPYWEKALRVEIPTDAPDLPLGDLKARAGQVANAIENINTLRKTYNEARNVVEFINDPIEYVGDEIDAAMRKEIESLIRDEGARAVAAYSPAASKYIADFDPSTPNPGNLLIAQLGQYARLIEQDPPDPEFRQVTPLPDPQARPQGRHSNSRSTLATQQADLAAGAARSMLRALERYQGADAAGDGSWALTHARSLQDVSAVLQQQLLTVADLLEQPDEQDAQAEHALAVLRDVATHGLAGSQVQLLRNIGLTQQQVDDAMTVLRAAALSVTPEQLADAEAEAAQAMRAFASELVPLATRAATAAEELSAAGVGQVPPYVTATARRNSPSGAVQLDAAATVSVGSQASLVWDLDGDGVFDDAAGASATIASLQTGIHVVAVEARDADGRTARAHVLVEGPQPHDLDTDALPVPGSTQVLALGGSAAFRLPASTPATWRVDGRTVHSGDGFDYQPVRLSDVGVREITATLAIAGGTAQLNWRMLVLAPDTDADGWRANADCDDSSPTTAPRTGSADDCDSRTIEAISNGVLITEEIPLRNVRQRYEVFLDRTFTVNAPDAKLIVSSNPDGTGTVFVDDELRAEVTRPDGTIRTLVFNYEWQKPSPPLDLSPALQSGRNTVRIILRDTVGGAVRSSELWLVNNGAAPSAGSTRIAAHELGLHTTNPQPVQALLSTTSGSADGVTFSIDEQPRQGSAQIEGATLTYTPAAGTSGTDRFSYRAHLTRADGIITTSAPALINVTVEPAPLAAPELQAVEALAVQAGGSAVRTISASGGSEVVLTAGGVPPFATFADHGNGTASLIAHAPPASSAGSHPISITASNAAGSDTLDLALQILGNRRPTAQGLHLSTAQATPVQGRLDATDPDGDALSLIVRTPSASGTVSTSGDTFTYTPRPGTSGSDAFLLDVTDGELAQSVVVTVHIEAPVRRSAIEVLPPVGASASLTAEAGRTIPIRWRVLDSEGTPTSDPTTIASHGFSTPGATSSLKVTGGIYHDNVQTPRIWAGQQQRYKIVLVDGTAETVVVDFKRK